MMSELESVPPLTPSRQNISFLLHVFRLVFREEESRDCWSKHSSIMCVISPIGFVVARLPVGAQSRSSAPGDGEDSGKDAPSVAPNNGSQHPPDQLYLSKVQNVPVLSTAVAGNKNHP